MRIEVDDLSRPEVHALLSEHLEDMHATSPAESVHALDLSGLRGPGVTVWTAWEADALLGIVALKKLSPDHAELKSMWTTGAARGQSVASRLLGFVLDQARERGYVRVSLETGTQDYFAAARRLYVRHGFVECPPFADYVVDPSSAFFSLSL
ncbi:GNAT family N-acetyltransferase [Rhodococcus sp. IEGM 1401]|uniref:GNAT family N-acetyltransferase n=1 Tax=unclassified Rhodococcus (in: high G+C Gram-positive bacteria) TaxID=192944 RepID=UPI0022B3EF17|nr:MULTISPECIES: GNAT family N-acetyltransferase [unclassified Rhodococcus (in: high G+C Gram-positive bacteria)]MCZ4562689.1 GNAT family N-acetyltransferase [Rhodococcus sp. IEGM 1401]MDI9922798.1 GNAT family N-acetyltransferase [Rhodococcus sp. IEGM 1372]MDV8035346.1 GNAT family N-acetyltransferase [Rhodococcus sp. IEGM 1414]